MGGESVCLAEITANHCEPMREKKNYIEESPSQIHGAFIFRIRTTLDYNLIDFCVACILRERWMTCRPFIETDWISVERQTDTRSMEAVGFLRDNAIRHWQMVWEMCALCPIIDESTSFTRIENTQNEKRGNSGASETTAVCALRVCIALFDGTFDKTKIRFVRWVNETSSVWQERKRARANCNMA